MSQFEYVTVVVSIVMAFAISEILSGIGRLIRERSRVRFYWVHISWMALGILWMLMHWWGIWDYRAVEFGGFFSFLALVLPALTFVLFAFLLTPTLAPGSDLDLRAYYARNQRWIFPLAALILVELSLLRMILTDEALLHPRNAFRALFAAGVIWLAASRNARLHALGVVLAFAGALLYAFVRVRF